MGEIPIISEPGSEGHYPVNMYWMPELDDGKQGFIGTPGLTLKHVIDSAGGAIRGMIDFQGDLYVVCKSTVYRYKDGAAIACTGSLLTSTGRVWMVCNRTQIMITDGTYGYYVVSTTLTQITDDAFPSPVTGLTYQDGYAIVTKGGTDEFYISDLNDFSSWDSTMHEHAIGDPDNLMVPFSDHRELILFGVNSMESYYNSGDANFTFSRIDGAHQEKGLGAAESPAKGDNTVFFFSNRRQVMRTPGVGQAPIVASTPQLDRHFQKMGTVSDAFGFCMDLGGTWYVITFPTENETWCYNAQTNRWHQWASFPYAGKHIRHRANCYCHHGGEHIVGDYDNGCIYKVDPFAFTDYGNSIRSQVIFPVIEKDGRWIYHNRLSVEVKMGVGIATGQGSDPKVMLEWSDTAMRTWSNEKWRSLGKIGEHKKEAAWHALGRSKRRNYRITITDPVEREISGANLDLNVGGY